jgi:enoyl-CoA hydratase/carnithine racemase
MNEMAKTDKVLSRKEGGVGYVVFNNPERLNAMSLDMWAATTRIMDEFKTDDSLRVVVLTGAGGKAFVSGADISRFGAERSNEAAVAHYNKTVEEASLALHTYPKPTIAMIRGYCIGGGLGIAMCCDMRIATEKSTFAVPAAKLGLGYGFLRIERMSRIMGLPRAMEFLFTARQYSSKEAYDMGLVHGVAADAELDAMVDGITGAISQNAPLTIALAKASAREIAKPESKQDHKKLEKMAQACFDSDDYKEGRRAFMEKRKPAFKGR